eukprot:scaffold7918_cov165-Amphora_coffeaeformis.AAC.10
MLPPDPDYFFCIDGVRLSRKQEEKKIAWDWSERSESLHTKKKQSVKAATNRASAQKRARKEEEESSSVGLDQMMHIETEKVARIADQVCAGRLPHELVKLPQYAAFRGQALVKEKTKFLQITCHCKKHRMRTYCQCSPGFMRCNDCFLIHYTKVCGGTPRGFKVTDGQGGAMV